MQVAKVPPSMLHRTVAGVSSTVKVKLALVWATVPVGPPVIVTVGPTVSTVTARWATGPVLPAGSVARIWS